MMWAEGPAPFIYHTSYGWYDFTINSEDDTVSFGGISEGSLDGFFLEHGIVLYIGWGAFALFQIATGRHLLGTWKYTYLFHRLVGDIISYGSLYYEIKAFLMRGEISNGHHNEWGFYFIFVGFLITFTGQMFALYDYP